MFKNRKLEMKVVKTPKNEIAVSEKSPREIAATVQAVSQVLIKETGKVVVAYMVLDTIRKVVLISAQKA